PKHLLAERQNAVPGKDGRLSFLPYRTDIAQRLRVEARGYRTQDGPEFRVGDDAARKQDFRLQPCQDITGAVVDTQGRPVAKAAVLLATETEIAIVGTHRDSQRVLTDAGGRFAFPHPGAPWAVVARTDAGFAMVNQPTDSHDAGTLKLRPWASVRGQFRDRNRLVSGASILLDAIQLLPA